MLEKYLAYEDKTVKIYSSNLTEVRGATTVVYHKPTKAVLVIDFGVGFSVSFDKGVYNEEAENWLEEIKMLNTKATVLMSHAHRDHYAGLGHLAKRFPGSDCFASMFSNLILKKEFEEINLNQHLIGQCGSIDVEPFKIHYGPMVHSIPGTRSFVIEYPKSNLVGKEKMIFLAEGRTIESSFSPGLSQRMFDFISRYAPYTVGLTDGLRGKEEGFTQPEDTIRKPLKSLFQFVPGDLYIPFISSKLALIYCIMDELKKLDYGFKARGTAMEDMVELGKLELGNGNNENLRLPEWRPDLSDFSKKIGIVATGSQCEPGSFMATVADKNSDRKSEILPNDFVFLAQGAIPQYIPEIRLMYERFASIVPEGGVIIGRREQKRLQLKAPNVYILEDITGLNSFELSSGHGKRGDIEKLKEFAPADTYIEYQSNPDVGIDETGISETESKKPLVELAREYVKRLKDENKFDRQPSGHTDKSRKVF